MKNIAKINTSCDEVTEQVLLLAYQIISRSIMGKLAMIEMGLKEYVHDVKLSSRRKMFSDIVPSEQYTIALCEIIERSLVFDSYER